MEEWSRTGLEEIYRGWHEGERPEMPDMWTGDSGLSGGLPDLYQLWRKPLWLIVWDFLRRDGLRPVTSQKGTKPS